jgi:hypothetical protein
VLVAAAAVALARLTRARATATIGIAAAAVALVAATPVRAAWTDDCGNRHSARVPLVAAPAVNLTKPRDARVSYEEVSTLIGCPRD